MTERFPLDLSGLIALITPEPLLACPFCRHYAYEPERVHGTRWGSWDWEIRCSSSHCAASVRLVADSWPDRLIKVRQMWNRRPGGGDDLIRAASESQAVDDEGVFPPLCDLIGYSGENKTRTVVRAALTAALAKMWDRDG